MASIRRDRYYVRDTRTVAVGTRDTFVFCNGKARSEAAGLDGPSMSRLLQRLAVPMSGRELLEAVDEQPAGLRPVLASLVDSGMVLEDRRSETLVAARDRAFADVPGYSFEPGPQRCDNLVIAMTGSVVSGLMAPFVFTLAYTRFHRQLDLIVTQPARSFVQPELFEYYGIRTWTDPFTRREGLPVPHILLAKSADLVLVMPATARSISRLASGECSDLLSLVAAATKAPVVVAPCMNTAMWDHDPVRRNVDQLRTDGFYVIEPTLFFEAAELIHGVEPAYGMPGVFWGGPVSLIAVLTAVLEHHGSAGLAPGSD